MKTILYTASAALAFASAAVTAQQNPAQVGSFSAPFAEPTIVVDGEEVATEEKCLTNSEGSRSCKPAAGTMSVLGDGDFIYFNALEGTEDVELSIVAEFGQVTINDQTRRLTLDENDNPTWTKPAPNRAGANPDGNDSTTLLGGALSDADSTNKNDGALFCSDVIFLANGDLMAVGGTDYYTEPGNSGLPIGVVELEGLKNSRIFDPDTNTWSQSGDMSFGRWYPTLSTLANGHVFVASGVTKLLKPVYPEDPLNSGRNVVQTETYNPETGEWTENGQAAQRSLPLFPRLHLLPNGHVLYNAVGQAFNPFGQAYDQPLWNIASAYNPDSQTWNDLGYAGLPLQLNELGLSALSTTLNPTNMDPAQVERLLTDLVGQTMENPQGAVEQLLNVPVDERALERAIGSGMRGSTFQIMMPLHPDENGEYHEANFLTAGGVPTYVAAGSPGGYLPISSSRIDTVTVHGNDMSYNSRLTGPLNQPRWYGQGVQMPDGSVMVFSGGTRDGVVLPGLENAIRQAERFDPETQTWQPMASSNRMRTYHNTEVLMPDGRVMMGGHAPISTAYLSNINLESQGFSPNDGRDPSFEIYTPPYAMRDDRPVINNAPAELSADGSTFSVQATPPNAIDQVMLIRRTATTHLVDGDQRAVVLPIVERNGANLTVQMPDNRAVAPVGPYMLFVSMQADDGMRVPSEAAMVMVADNSGETTAVTQVGQSAPSDGDSASPVDALQGGDPVTVLEDTLGDLNGIADDPGGASGGDASPLRPLEDLAGGGAELGSQFPGTLPLFGEGIIEGVPPIIERTAAGQGAGDRPCPVGPPAACGSSGGDNGGLPGSESLPELAPLPAP